MNISEVGDVLDKHNFSGAAIVRHGYTDYMRDYDVLVAGIEGPPFSDAHRYQFVMCVYAVVNTNVDEKILFGSFEDELVLSDINQSGDTDKECVHWGVRESTAQFGLELVQNSEIASEWTRKLRRPMSEIRIETEIFRLDLVFAELRYEKIQNLGDYHLGGMMPVSKSTLK